MIALNSEIKDALIKIDFVKRYEEISNKYNATRLISSNRLVYVDGEIVMDMLRELGYSPAFDPKEKFYKIQEENIGAFSFGVHIILRDGMVDMVWIVKRSGELLLGAPWGTYSRRLIDNGYRIKKPVFGSYEELDEIMKEMFAIYRDFKQAIVDKWV